MKITWRVIRGGRMGEKVQGIRSINCRYKIDRERVRTVWGNGEAKELICTTHGYGLTWGNAGWSESTSGGD